MNPQNRSLILGFSPSEAPFCGPAGAAQRPRFPSPSSSGRSGCSGSPTGGRRGSERGRGRRLARYRPLQMGSRCCALAAAEGLRSELLIARRPPSLLPSLLPSLPPPRPNQSSPGAPPRAVSPSQNAISLLSIKAKRGMADYFNCTPFI